MAARGASRRLQLERATEQLVHSGSVMVMSADVYA